MTILLLLFFGHFISDFVLQPREIAKQRGKKDFLLLIHALIVFLVIGLCLYLVTDFKTALMLSSINTLLHLITDRLIWKGYRYFVIYRRRKLKKDCPPYHKDYWFYNFMGFDQFIHLITFLGLYKIMLTLS